MDLQEECSPSGYQRYWKVKVNRDSEGSLKVYTTLQWTGYLVSDEGEIVDLNCDESMRCDSICG